MNLVSASTALLDVATGCLAYQYGKFHIHMLQMNSYRVRRYARWIMASGSAWVLTITAWALAADCLPPFIHALPAIAVVLLCWKLRKSGRKKPLVVTVRVARIALVLAALEVLIALQTGQFAITTAAIPVVLIVAILLLMPIEAGITRYYKGQAVEKLSGIAHIRTIGITGSYGKTSTKNFLADILGGDFDVLASPASVNTPMGLTRVIRENLSPLHDIFIAEMGAKQKGDIAELVELVRPSLGIISSVGIMHLETFGSEDAIYQTKLELADIAGPIIVDGDNKRLVEMAILKNRQVITCGKGQDCDYSYTINAVSSAGTAFTVLKKNGQQLNEYQTRIVGAPFIHDIVLAIAAADVVGTSQNTIKGGIRRLRPVKHRLEVLQNGSMTIIDDSFNANPIGAKAALEVLAMVEGPARYVVTPGFVELGARQEAANAEFATKATSIADALIVVGETNREALTKGDAAKTITVKTLEEAMQYIRSNTPAGAAVLLENDLPDNFR